MLETVGVLLAGGESRRFGYPKAFAEFKGKLFWEYSYYAMKDLTEVQMIISLPQFIERFQEYRTCHVLMDDEEVKGKGPLAGIYTAMKQKKAEWYVVLACDVPFITKSTINNLLHMRQSNFQAVIPKINGRVHPLIGIYHQSSFPFIKQLLLNHEHKMIAFLKQIDVLYVSEEDLAVDSKVFSNINSQKDFTKLHLNE